MLTYLIMIWKLGTEKIDANGINEFGYQLNIIFYQSQSDVFSYHFDEGRWSHIMVPLFMDLMLIPLLSPLFFVWNRATCPKTMRLFCVDVDVFFKLNGHDTHKNVLHKCINLSPTKHIFILAATPIWRDKQCYKERQIIIIDDNKKQSWTKVDEQFKPSHLPSFYGND